MSLCSMFWGSHGCDLDKGHLGRNHQCWDDAEPCSQYDSGRKRARHWDDETGEWGEWMNCEGFKL